MDRTAEEIAIMKNRQESIKMICSRVQMSEWLNHEKERYHARFGLYYLLQIRENEILYKHMRLLRHAEYYKNTKRRLLFKIAFFRLLRFQNKYSLHIPLNSCGRGFKIMHLGPVLMNGRAKVGQDCTLHMNTALVAGGTDDDAPVLGNNVVVGFGAVVLGGVHIADNVAIGANAVVNRDVSEENIAVAGVPAKKISNHGSIYWNVEELSKLG